MNMLLVVVVALAMGFTAGQQCSCGCKRDVPVTTTTFSLPSMPTAFPTHHLSNVLASSMMPQCMAPQGYVPMPMPQMPMCYQPPPYMMPAPSPPNISSKTTVQQQQAAQAGAYPGYPAMPSQTPVVVQSVYVGKREDEETDNEGEKSKKKSTKRKCSEEVEEDEHEEERSYKRKRRRRTRKPRRRIIDLIDHPLDPYDEDDPSEYSERERHRCDGCCPPSSPRIVYIDNQ